MSESGPEELDHRNPMEIGEQFIEAFNSKDDIHAWTAVVTGSLSILNAMSSAAYFTRNEPGMGLVTLGAAGFLGVEAYKNFRKSSVFEQKSSDVTEGQ